VSHTRNPAEVPEVVRRPSRLRALAELEANAESSAEALDRIARIACRVLDVPVVLVNLVGADRQRFIGCGGPEPWASMSGMPITAGFCPFALGADTAYALEDARVEPGQAANLAVEQYGVVAYAGVPLRAGGEAVGTLCAIDFKPRTWSEDDLGVLADLAGGATAELQLLAATRTVARHSASLQALTQLSNGLATAQTADDVLRELLPALERFHASAVRVLLTDESGHALHTAAATDGSRHADLPLTPAEVAPDFLLTRADLPDRLDALLEDQPDVVAVALLPLTAGDAEIGALALCFTDERAFSTQDRDYLMAVGGVAGMALARRAGRR
jgi:GAF domain-containing protein